MAKWGTGVGIALFLVALGNAEGSPPLPVATVPPPTERGANTSMDLSPAILDLSSYTDVSVGEIDAKLKTELGIEVILHRATMGDNKSHLEDLDQDFHERAPQIVHAGFRLGAYHWATPTGTGREQADYFLNEVQLACKKFPAAKRRVLLAFDWEHHPDSRTFYMSAVEAEAFLGRVKQRTGTRILVYASEAFLRERGKKIREEKSRLWDVLGEHPLWIARYGAIPDVRFKEPFPWVNWKLWQYTDPRNESPTTLLPPGEIAGKRVDRSVFHGSRADLLRFVDDHSWNCSDLSSP